MSASLLREAAALMRERAEAATPGPWHICGGDEYEGDWADQRVSGPGHEPIAGLHDDSYESDPGEPTAASDATHIASWHPAVALAVADWLEGVAAWDDEGLGDTANLNRTNWPSMWGDMQVSALAIATAYLSTP